MRTHRRQAPTRYGAPYESRAFKKTPKVGKRAARKNAAPADPPDQSQTPEGRQAMVAPGDGAQRRARPQTRRVHVAGSQEDRRFAQKIGAGEQRGARPDPFRSALSMLTFYINRAGKNLPPARKRTLMRAKDELRSLYGRA